MHTGVFFIIYFCFFFLLFSCFVFSLSERKTSIFAVFIFCYILPWECETHARIHTQKKQKINRFSAFYFQIIRTSCHIININNGVSFSFILSITMIQWTEYHCQHQNEWKFFFRKKKENKIPLYDSMKFPKSFINASRNANFLLSIENMLHRLQKTKHNNMIQCEACVCKTIIYKFPVDWTQPDLICTQAVLFGGCMSIHCAFVCIHFTRCELEKAIKSSFIFFSLSLFPFLFEIAQRTYHWYSGYRTVGYRLIKTRFSLCF